MHFLLCFALHCSYKLHCLRSAYLEMGWQALVVLFFIINESEVQLSKRFHIYLWNVLRPLSESDKVSKNQPSNSLRGSLKLKCCYEISREPYLTQSLEKVSDITDLLEEFLQLCRFTRSESIIESDQKILLDKCNIFSLFWD